MARSKSDLISIVAERAGTPKTVTKIVLDLAFAAINEMAATDTVAIHNFGVFKTKVRAARTGRNPMTGESLQIPESEVLSFKATKHKS